MIKNPYGYACICLTLQDQGVFTGRTLTQKTFKAKGLEYVSSLALQNVIDLKKVILWNIENKFEVFRMTSDLFPWWSEYNFEDLKDFEEIKATLKTIGVICDKGFLRLSFHPDHFTKLASDKPEVVKKALRDIEQHSKIFDLMGFQPSHFNKINIHIGGAYGNKSEAIERFCVNFSYLSENAKKRLTVENDDKFAMYSVKDLFEGVYNKIGIPIVFDYHHHKFNDGGISEQGAFQLAHKTWGGMVPVFHYSESREGNERAHSDYVKCNGVNTYGRDAYVIIEAKAKDLAVFDLLKRKG